MNDQIYQAWHRRLGHAEFRLHITMEGYGDDEDVAVEFLEGFEGEHPEVGAAISQDRVADTITATFSLSATNEQHALSLGAMIWVESGASTAIVPNDVIRTEIERINEEDCGELAKQSDQPLVKA